MGAYIDGFIPAKPAQSSRTYIRRPTTYAPRPTVFSEAPAQPIAVEQKPKVPIEALNVDFEMLQSPQVMSTFRESEQHTVEMPDWQDYRKPRRKHNSRLAHNLIIAMAFVVFSAGLFVAYHGFRNNQALAKQYSSSQLGSESPVALGPDNVSEEPVSESTFTNHVVAPDAPRLLTVPKLNIQARILPVGVDEKDELRTPQSIFDAGWYEGSAKPGSYFAATLLNGHLSGPTKPGIFSKLHLIKADDVIGVERGDGQKYNYRVVSKETVPYSQIDMAKAMSSIETDKGGLNIITCAGTYLPEEKTFEKRLVVYAVLD